MLRNGVELVRVATGAGERDAQQHGAQRFGAVEVVLGLKLRRNGAALGRGRIHPHEAGGDALFERCIGEQVTRELPGDEVIERQVLVHGMHDPIAIRINPAAIVQMQPVRIAVTNRVEPIAGLMLAESRAGHELVDQPLVGIDPFVSQKRGKLRRLRRQAGQHERGATGQRRAIGLGGKRQPLLFKLRDDIGINAAFGCGLVGRRLPSRRNEGPVLRILPALANPTTEQIAFLGRKLLLGLLGRHRFIGRVQADEHLTFLRRVGVNRPAAIVLASRRRVRIETKRFLLLAVGAVTDEALVREDRQDFATEVDGFFATTFFRLERRREQQCAHDEQQAGEAGFHVHRSWLSRARR